MKIELILEQDSDLKVVNAARISFDKESRELNDKDIKLINYLVTHSHWTPFAHCQEVFQIRLENFELIDFLTGANLSGFEWLEPVIDKQYTDYDVCYRDWKIRGSLYAWLTNIQYLPQIIKESIWGYLSINYPVSTRAILGEIPSPRFSENIIMIDHPLEPELLTHTLRITVPIFIKRQLETHRRNLILTDMEDFSQNEVSRRYIDTEPEIYYPTKWRVQSLNKKQGSSDEQLSDAIQILTKSNYNHHCHSALNWYKSANERGIAHEQSRLFLPVSTYTSFWWTGSVKSWRRIINLRDDSHAQDETQEVAHMIKETLSL